MESSGSDSTTLTQVTMVSREEVEKIVEETVATVAKQDDIIFKKPTTLRDWIYIIATIVALLGMGWSAIVKLNAISEHQNLPYHHGVEELVAEVKEAVHQHINDEEHHIRRADVTLQILEETRPMKQDVQNIKQDIGIIKTNMDILLDRHRHMEHRSRE